MSGRGSLNTQDWLQVLLAGGLVIDNALSRESAPPTTSLAPERAVPVDNPNRTGFTSNPVLLGVGVVAAVGLGFLLAK